MKKHRSNFDWGRPFRFLLAFCLCLLFTGCTSQVYTIEVQENGASKLTIELGMKADDYTELQVHGTKTGNLLEQQEDSPSQLKRTDVIFQELAAVYYREGFTVEAINDAAQTGFKATKNYGSATELNADLKKLNEEGLCGLTGKVSRESGLIQDTYVFSGKLEFVRDPDLDKLSAEEKKLVEELIDPDSLHSEVRVSLPGDIDKSPDGEVQNNQAVIMRDSSSDKEQQVRVASTVLHTPIVTAILTVAGLIGIALFVFMARRARIRKDQRREREFYK